MCIRDRCMLWKFCARMAWRTANRLLFGCHRQTAVRIQRLVGVRQYVRPTAHRSVHPSQCALQLRPRRISVRLKNCAEPPTNGCSTASSATNTTFCTIYCRQNLKQRLNVTICARAHTTLNYQNVVRVSQTAVILNECYLLIFTEYCSTSLTEPLY